MRQGRHQTLFEVAIQAARPVGGIVAAPRQLGEHFRGDLETHAAVGEPVALADAGDGEAGDGLHFAG